MFSFHKINPVNQSFISSLSTGKGVIKSSQDSRYKFGCEQTVTWFLWARVGKDKQTAMFSLFKIKARHAHSLFYTLALFLPLSSKSQWSGHKRSCFRCFFTQWHFVKQSVEPVPTDGCKLFQFFALQTTVQWVNHFRYVLNNSSRMKS